MEFKLTPVDIYSAVTAVLYIIGCWKLFEKRNIKGWWAVVPFARHYHLGLAGGRDREDEGRVYTFLYGILTVLDIVRLFTTEKADDVTNYIYLVVTLAALIYRVRICVGICRIFERKKTWIILWVLTPWLAALIFGLHPAFQPNMTLTDLKAADAAQESGSTVEALDKGLTVNIKERTAIDFFQKKVLLRDIHLRIPVGHMVLLLGGSGAGKTTFVNAVTGYEQADAEILLNGRDLYTDYDELKYDVGFVPQLDLMRGNDTVNRTLADAAALRLPSSVKYAEEKQRVRDVLDAFGLSAVKSSLVEKLSGGQRKRLSIGMEFISDPVLFILDEPDSGLDGVVARSLFKRLREIADEGKIVIVITHTPDRVIDLFDDVIVLAKDGKRTGRLAYFGPIQEAREFFGKETMEEILLSINQKEEGGEGRADEFIEKYGAAI